MTTPDEPRPIPTHNVWNRPSCQEIRSGCTFLSLKLRSYWQGPREVVAQLSEVVYQVRMPGRGRVVVLHMDRLAPYFPLALPAV